MKKIFTICIAIVSLTSCKKNDEALPQLEINKANIAGTYLLTGATEAVDGVVKDIYASEIETCEKDNTHTYTASGNYSYVDAGLQCTPPSSPINAIYTITGNEISMLGEKGIIESLTAKNLIYSITEVFGGKTYKVTFTFTRQ